MCFRYRVSMRYTLGQAQAFYWVARLGGFRAAAAHLNLSQPTVSLRVRDMERGLGGSLFDRDGYRPKMSGLGAAIFPDVERLLSHAERIQKTAREPTPGRGLLRIGAADSFAARILPDLLASTADRYPSLQVDVTVDFSTRLERLLLDRSIDIAFLSQPRVHDKVSIVPLWSIDLVWVVAKGFPLEPDIATPENLVDLPIFTNASPSSLFTTIQTWFGSRGLKPLRLNTCNPLTVIARLANAGTGVALLPREMLRLAGDDVSLRILKADPPVPEHQLCAMWWQDETARDCESLTAIAKQIHARVPI
jgi:DNA-binding transcriptional LysR family regulator